MQCSALELGERRTALPGGAGVPDSPLTPSYFREPDGVASNTPPPPRRRFQKAGWVGLQVSRERVA